MSDIRPHWHGDVNPGHPQGSRPAPQDVDDEMVDRFIGASVEDGRAVAPGALAMYRAARADLAAAGNERDEFRAKAEDEYQRRVAARADLAAAREQLAAVEALCDFADAPPEHTMRGVIDTDDIRAALETKP